MRNITDNQNYCLTQNGVSPIIAILRHWKTLMYIYQGFQTLTLVEKTTIFIFFLKFSTKITPKIPLIFPSKTKKKREETSPTIRLFPFFFLVFLFSNQSSCWTFYHVDRFLCLFSKKISLYENREMPWNSPIKKSILRNHCDYNLYF